MERLLRGLEFAFVFATNSLYILNVLKTRMTAAVLASIPQTVGLEEIKKQIYYLQKNGPNSLVSYHIVLDVNIFFYFNKNLKNNVIHFINDEFFIPNVVLIPCLSLQKSKQEKLANG